MRLKQSASRYWLASGAIALVGGLAAVGTGAEIWNTVQQIDPALAENSTLHKVAFLVPALGSLATVAAAIATLSVIQKKHKTQEQRFRRIFEGAAIGIGLDSLNGTIEESNPALQEMLGYSHDELVRMTFSEFTHPDDLAADNELFNEMISGTRDSYQVEKRHLRKDGKPLWVRITNSLVRNQRGTPQYTIAVAENISQLKQAQESVQLYGDIAKRMQIGLLVWQLPDLNDLTSFRLVECNPAAHRILQVQSPIEKMLGRPMAAVFPDLVDTAFPKIYADVIRSGKERDLGEVRYGDRTIPEGIFATKAFPLPNQCVGLIFEDITERKQAELALLQSEARFRVVAETASCAFLIYQGNHLRYVNPATEAITGYSREELMTIPFWELAHPDFRQIVRDRGLARQRGETVPPRYEIKILTKSGKERWVDMTAGSAYLNGQPAAIATAYDITERKEAEAQLQLAANRERLLSETALRIRGSLNLDDILNTTVAEVREFLQADRVLIAQFSSGSSCQTVAESVSPNWLPVLGWVTDSYAVEEMRQLFKRDSVRVVNDTSQIEKTPFLKEYYDRCQVRAGMGVPIMQDNEMFGVLIVNQCSGPRQWQPFEIDLLKKLGTQVEIAIQQGQLYQQLRMLASNLECQVEERTLELKQRMHELQSLNQVKDVLLHAVTHDLRTPVQGMLMVLNHLRGRCNETVSIPRSMLERMIESSDRQLTLLNSLMENHAAKPCKQQALNRETILLNCVLENALASLEPQLCKNQARIVNYIGSNLPPTTADPNKVQYVLENLLLNAIKHNPPGRTITLEATIVTTDSDESNTQFLWCSVQDDGTGMDKEQCDRLFQLYVRGLDNQRLTGIGLGLHRCQQIIAAHGGEIGVESQPGQGSKFWFTLPLVSTSAQPSVSGTQCEF
ncbi:MAG: PAS domain S-box protein [Oscillatoriales cyanobacterium C42_A2020_001]|nr:PAS domain S-box protein [Leptolyngbyaceae cyanobacterium C42_A2020_001]